MIKDSIIIALAFTTAAFAILAFKAPTCRDIFPEPMDNPHKAFSQVPTDQVHVMRVWEDGSYEIVYKDKTSERGCLPTGLCQD